MHSHKLVCSSCLPIDPYISANPIRGGSSFIDCAYVFTRTSIPIFEILEVIQFMSSILSNMTRTAIRMGNGSIKQTSAWRVPGSLRARSFAPQFYTGPKVVYASLLPEKCAKKSGSPTEILVLCSVDLVEPAFADLQASRPLLTLQQPLSASIEEEVLIRLQVVGLRHASRSNFVVSAVSEGDKVVISMSLQFQEVM
jgi:hypothetical protein